MKLHKEIKKHRLTLDLSQEELADKLYVSRQSISNWETGKNYPDIHSLVFMSDLFQVTIDQLLKGDLDIMKNEIQMEEVEKFKSYSRLYTILLCSTILAIAPLCYYLEEVGIGILALLFALTMYVALKVEKLKKVNDIQTYKEIVSFIGGEHLDELHKQREFGKRSYQKGLLMVSFGGITFFIVMIMMYILSVMS